MTKILHSLLELDLAYRVLYCDLWGCLHDGRTALPAAVAALTRWKAGGGTVLLLTNSPRPARDVIRQLDGLGAPRSCYDLIVTSGDAAQAALAAGLFGRRVFHIGPERDLSFFRDETGQPLDIELVPIEAAEGIVCTGLFDDATETPQDYRATILYGKTKGLKLLCANPDVVVDVGDRRIFCAGAIAQAYSAAGGQSFYFGKPYPPIYQLARAKVIAHLGAELPADEILCIGDGIATDIQGAMGESLDSLFITGGLAADETSTSPVSGPDPLLLAAFLAAARMEPLFAMAYLR